MADGWRDRRADGGMVHRCRRPASRCCAACRCRIRRACTTAGSGCSTPAPASSAFVDRDAQKFEAVAFCPGYARGLAFIGPYAIVGLSLARENRTFQGLPLDEALAARGAEPRCGLLVVDTKSGDTVDWVRIEGVVRELFDVAVLPGVRNPAAIGFVTDEIQRVISIDET